MELTKLLAFPLYSAFPHSLVRYTGILRPTVVVKFNFLEIINRPREMGIGSIYLNFTQVFLRAVVKREAAVVTVAAAAVTAAVAITAAVIAVASPSPLPPAAAATVLVVAVVVVVTLQEH